MHWLASFDHSTATTPAPEADQLFLGPEGISVAFGVEEFLEVVDDAWREPEQVQPVAEGAAGFYFGVGGGVEGQGQLATVTGAWRFPLPGTPRDEDNHHDAAGGCGEPGAVLACPVTDLPGNVGAQFGCQPLDQQQ
ncbi:MULTISPECIES: hypothetical protein [unclassified Streptomyces]|uniref:hypothetical protein n=1 Tax=unclassified Streptomyces TaxID=2593676 RepID=UPI0036FB152E